MVSIIAYFDFNFMWHEKKSMVGNVYKNYIDS